MPHQGTPVLGACPRQGCGFGRGGGDGPCPQSLRQTTRCGGKPWPPDLGDAGGSGAIFNPLLAELPLAGVCVLQWGGRGALLPRLRCPSPEGLNFYPGFRPTFNPQLLANNALAKLGKMRPLPMSGAGFPPGS